MSISAISSSSTYGYTNYGTSTSKRKSSSEDPMSAAISKLQDSNPTLAKKLQSISDQMSSLKESGASKEDVMKAMKDGMDSLSESERSAVGEAMGPPPSGGPGGARPMGPPPTESSSSDSDSDDSTDSSSITVDLRSFLDSLSSSQNEAIVNYLTQRANSTSTTSSSSSATAIAA